MLVLRATSDIENYFLSEAEDELAEALVGLGCKHAADAELLGKLWQADGVLASLQGNPDRAALALSASARMLPDRWNVNFGTEAQKMYVYEPSVDTGILIVKGTRSKDVLVDGVPTKVPTELEVGLHLVQVGTFPDDTEFGSEVIITKGAESVVMARVTEAVAVAGLPVGPPSDGSSRPFAVAGGGAAAVALTSFLMASSADKKFMDESDEAAAKAHLQRNHAMNITGLTVTAAGAGLLGVAVLKGQW